MRASCEPSSQKFWLSAAGYFLILEEGMHGTRPHSVLILLYQYIEVES